MGLYLRAKFQVSSIILPPLPPPPRTPPSQNEPLKSPPRLGLKNNFKFKYARETRTNKICLECI